jgi:hypothetical protein
MRYKICAFNDPLYVETASLLMSTLKNDYLNWSVSVKYITKSGLIGVVFIDVSRDAQCRGSYSDQLIDFNELDKLAAIDFKR